jgi:hypothetical protein
VIPVFEMIALLQRFGADAIFASDAAQCITFVDFVNDFATALPAIIACGMGRRHRTEADNNGQHDNKQDETFHNQVS